MVRFRIAFGFWLVVVGAGCEPGGSSLMEDPLPAVPINLADALPSPERNPLTSEGVALGRSLFYDPILSDGNEVSCATCHVQAFAFSDGAVVSTAGETGVPLLRHTPTLINLAWMDGYFWDGGGYDLESLAFGPLGHPDEMGQDLNELITELEGHPTYPSLFQAAFSDGITLPNVVRALAQFQRTLISANSPYDRMARGEPGVSFTPEDEEGHILFMAYCASCHASDFFTDQSYRNTGLDTEYPLDHERIAWGRARVTEDLADMGKFKVPTLRNVVLTAPYMHDGRFNSLEAVLEHYRFGVKDTPTLDPVLRRADGGLGIEMTDADAARILSFLKKLTDSAFVSNPAFAVPKE